LKAEKNGYYLVWDLIAFPSLLSVQVTTCMSQQAWGKQAKSPVRGTAQAYQYR